MFGLIEITGLGCAGGCRIGWAPVSSRRLRAGLTALARRDAPVA